jgi:streptogramin lyase
VDRDSDSVLKVDAKGRIHTVAGTHTLGFNGDGPAQATTLNLSQPNGLYVKPDGSFFILDTGNNRVRHVDTNGVMSTLFVMSAGINPGRGLWVADSGSEALFCGKTILQAWDSTNGVFALNNNFVELGNIYVPAPDYVLVTDRGANKVYQVATHGPRLGQRTLLYGDGNTHTVVDGSSAVTSSLNGVRGIWPLLTGGFLLALHEGAQILYVDPADRVYVFLDGQNGTHAGDGSWFYSPGPKIAQARSVTMDYSGNILIVENDFGYVRQIDFHRLTP